MAIACSATAPLPLSHHRRSRTVDSYFHVDFGLEVDDKNDEHPALNIAPFVLTSTKKMSAHVARPGHARRSKSVDGHTNGKGHRRSKSYKISGSTLASFSSGKTSSKPKAVRKAKKGVKFGQVHTRGFNLVVSEHPSVTSGLGIELGWEHCTLSSLNIDEYEQRSRNAPGEARRFSEELLLSRKKRNRKLLKYGNYSEREIFMEERKREISARTDFFGPPVKSFDM